MAKKSKKVDSEVLEDKGPPISRMSDKKAAEHIIGILAGISATMTADDEPFGTVLHKLAVEVDRRWYRRTPSPSEKLDKLIARLTEAGLIGLDLSPGDALAAEAAQELVKLRDRVTVLELELGPKK